MRIATVTAILAAALPAFAVMPPVPRPAKELVITEPSGKKTLLTSLKGKVVYIQFLFTTCPHCQHLSQVMTKISADLAPKGLQVLGLGFDNPAGTPDGTPPTPAMITNYAKQFAGFPVGFAPRDTVMSYLGISVMDRMVVPQIVIVDRKGTIRAQSEFMGDKANVNGSSIPYEQLQDDTFLRKFLGDLLKEGAGAATSSAPKTPAPPNAVTATSH
ncbi:MAG TPA: TlpA disulfide reductase family protein [Bryobacteraceae bacterium]|nr:TlpA disulfide reductase family protein [Bryobacteraceae bacterium]